LFTAKQRAKANAEFYKAARLADANQLKYTSEYLQHQLFLALWDRPKTFYGKNLPDMFAGASDTEFLPSMAALNLTTNALVRDLLRKLDTDTSSRKRDT